MDQLISFIDIASDSPRFALLWITLIRLPTGKLGYSKAKEGLKLSFHGVRLNSRLMVLVTGCWRKSENHLKPEAKECYHRI